MNHTEIKSELDAGNRVARLLWKGLRYIEADDDGVIWMHDCDGRRLGEHPFTDADKRSTD